MERETAWQRFFKIRGDTYDEMNQFYKLRSKEHYNGLYKEIHSLKYSMVTDAIFFFDRENMESMKKNGKWLKEAGQKFK